ncbi:polypeptide N-acetylgalactosaminyltransferase 18 [Physeter macrocephalus]|uniref:Polypeptide N-acetylgalactosaminyltransferase n=1 Tax=Physeter macrocephalus TaxID=9755 RepID=A0A455C5U3_PHYMC|nr:polypeptide N-acetylgalactosaminyltransferase 18 [Physeter catodon]|eukprot:XP_028356705.1 polypeptide N-acetylgalactosaminyltransferase 18 [Physeter catodon]
MVCTRKTKTLVSTCVILSGMTNIICLLYVGWVTNYIASVYVRGQEPAPDKKLEEDKGDTLKIIERLDHLENVIKQHIQEAPAKPEEAEAEPFTDSSLFAHWGQDLSPEGRRVALKQFQYYGYNAYLSDRLPLDRPLPDLRPSGCHNLSFPSSLPEVSIVFIFVNEALSVLLRSIHSAIERTPPHLLKEIILVDDNSSNEELKEKLSEYVDKVNGQKPGFIKVVRHSKQEGLIRSRVSGWRAATAPVVALFDAHVEFNVGWAEPVLTRIKENRKRIISPSFDNIKYDNFEIEEYPLAAQGFDWELWCRYLNPPKAWWKLENSTAPIRSPALIGCFIVDRQYFQEIGLLDEGMEVYGGENVELGIRPIVYICHGMTPQNVYYTSSQQIQVGVLSPTVDDDDNRCLVDVNSRPRLIECSYAKAKRMKLHWQFSQGGPIQNRKSKRCLELQENSGAEFGFQLVLQRCSGQHWTITNVLRSLAS